jgi:hypothetical protein
VTVATGYWKFLGDGARSPFTGFRWETAEWAAAAGQDPCRDGFHACRAGDLPYWLNDELWVVELAAPVVVRPHKVVARRARLVEKVEEWSSATAREFAGACVARTAGHAADALDACGLREEASRIREAARGSGFPVLLDVAQAAADAARDDGSKEAATLCHYVADAVEAVEAYPVASVAYIAARTANQRTTTADADPYTAERRWQSRWLERRLRIR